MSVDDKVQPVESRTFEADVAKLLHLMVHSVYSERDIFLRELISNAADACEKLRYEAIAKPSSRATTPSPASASLSTRTNDASRFRTTASA